MEKMLKTISLGAVAGVVTAAGLVVLSVLDLVSKDDMMETLGKTLLIIGVVTVTFVVIQFIVASSSDN
jgi:uncharacterized membrane protein